MYGLSTMVFLHGNNNNNFFHSDRVKGLLVYIHELYSKFTPFFLQPFIIDFQKMSTILCNPYIPCTKCVMKYEVCFPITMNKGLLLNLYVCAVNVTQLGEKCVNYL